MSPKLVAQYLLPHRFLSRIAHGVARIRVRWFKNWLTDLVIRKFDVNLAEAANPDPHGYVHFNAFFTRALREGARPADPDPASLLMPADGRVHQVGRIREGRMVQAKGQEFTIAELLGDEAAARAYEDGWFANIYLSPRDYHRVHMPWAGRLTHTLHIPGRLFSVAPWAMQAIPRLCARNERLVCHFDTGFGPMCQVMVGAILVSGVETVWGGEEIPPYASRVRERDWRNQGIELGRHEEMARFNYGSTVIVLFPRDAVVLEDDLQPQQPVRMGQRLGRVLR
ncbi:archaetidylserine decarboxylase [Alkalisalibacterium limincola]|uniref:Phosphatidylserine decarboxylase proenzyme n=1 Tax=Alkalisalibacterium limincola TaxID=2699169 RepID=A0A5C8KRR1_9GAMM|nr:archaetidylserine decarboxylase [Alkalisalibacterium limincola]TXK62029.1 phosphatidylserine decarboxylase [Alkalisalibacterium limincola]